MHYESILFTFEETSDVQTYLWAWMENCQDARGCFSTGDCKVERLSMDFTCSYHGFTENRT